jgi:hypothetical protein
MYTSPVVAPWLRENFGFHAAYLMGNFLFGTIKPDSKCIVKQPITSVEGYIFDKGNDMLKPREYQGYLKRCGIVHSESVMVTNDAEELGGYASVHKVNMDKMEEAVCGLRTLTSSARIIQTFGSRFGFWATALQGSRGGFVNGIDRICVNLTNSQQGSIWHTFCPADKAGYIFRTNSRLYICESYVDDIKLYIDYLLW